MDQNALRSRDDTVVRSVPLDFDRRRFLKAIEAEDYARACKVYGGEFLPVFAASGRVRFKKWVDRKRYRLK